MEIPTKLVVFFSVLLFFMHSSSISAHVVGHEVEFEYKKGSVKGPEQWGNLKKEWEACNNGRLQSPIDLTSQGVKITPELGLLNKSYNPCSATLKNRGHDISLFWDGNAGSILVNGVVYNLQQIHWHSPTEHTVNGKRFDLELHMVHQTPDNKIAVVGQLYQIGQPDPFVAQLSVGISGMIDQMQEKKMGVMNPADIKFGGTEYYRYIGSLTVPPCTEGVIWTLNKEIGTVSKEQVDLLREAVYDYAEFNARPTQALNNREISLYSANSKI
ncbi:alpha carbonic anhydrase 7-like [Momordica charantia]|uniref:Alpha carbonic anhydrase 7-like n=1 Tax=Momordica charantia TaxID=3673 RepID=A0A6J1CPY5_MOMCH|nr:alpha carbonic anhydrase 7-like [Momordica charantia]